MVNVPAAWPRLATLSSSSATSSTGVSSNFNRLVTFCGECLHEPRTHLRPAGGFSAEVAAASTIALATFAKVRISTTHAIWRCRFRCWRDAQHALCALDLGETHHLGVDPDLPRGRTDWRRCIYGGSRSAAAALRANSGEVRLDIAEAMGGILPRIHPILPNFPHRHPTPKLQFLDVV